jgi:hypothetical protein
MHHLLQLRHLDSYRRSYRRLRQNFSHVVHFDFQHHYLRKDQLWERKSSVFHLVVCAPKARTTLKFVLKTNKPEKVSLQEAIASVLLKALQEETDSAVLRKAVDHAAKATDDFAQMRMNASIKRALAGKNVAEI